MESIKAIIVDDEKNNRLALHKLIEKFCPQVVVIAECDSVDATIDTIEKTPADVIFLDVEMPGKNGFDLLAHYNYQCPFEIIFTTAYSQYAVKAFRFSALDYLLKPVDPEELIRAVHKLSVKISEEVKNKQFELLEQKISNKDSGKKQLAISTLEGIYFASLDEIIHVDADSSYTKIFLTTGEMIMSSKPLKYFEELLEDFDFVRVHQSHIINLKLIRRYVRGDGGQVIMMNGTEIEVSRRKKDDLLAKISDTL
ncbi:MAG: response regulator transcription factor [Sphingobacteriales bacterium]|jgi:two-component system LytT family response regulator|nr:response regulator transcription factor [Sphingobacteriales bacterium]MBP8192403.1 response regulator transcription factor [Chitinophagales bacterium]HNY54445.1 LytTR family DNA-binding domain-containing protein [Chitinophagales bacterium]